MSVDHSCLMQFPAAAAVLVFFATVYRTVAPRKLHLKHAGPLTGFLMASFIINSCMAFLSIHPSRVAESVVIGIGF